MRVYFNNTELANILAAFDITNFTGSINGNIYKTDVGESNGAY